MNNDYQKEVLQQAPSQNDMTTMPSQIPLPNASTTTSIPSSQLSEATTIRPFQNPNVFLNRNSFNNNNTAASKSIGFNNSATTTSASTAPNTTIDDDQYHPANYYNSSYNNNITDHATTSGSTISRSNIRTYQKYQGRLELALFIKILLKVLHDQGEILLYEQVRMVISMCTRGHQLTTSFPSLSSSSATATATAAAPSPASCLLLEDILKAHLRPLVGESYWQRATHLQRHYLEKQRRRRHQILTQAARLNQYPHYQYHYEEGNDQDHHGHHHNSNHHHHGGGYYKQYKNRPNLVTS